MYRAVTLYSLQHGLITDAGINEEALRQQMSDIMITFQLIAEGTFVTDNTPVTTMATAPPRANHTLYLEKASIPIYISTKIISAAIMLLSSLNYNTPVPLPKKPQRSPLSIIKPGTALTTPGKSS